MRRHLVAAMATCLIAAGCSDDATSYRGDRYSLTIFAYDAVTGAPISSANLVSGLALYEGADKVQPAALNSANGGAVFKDVPADYFLGNKVYPILANVSGYQIFQGEVSFKTNHDLVVGDGTKDSAFQDDLFAQVAYVHLYPLDYHAPDYTFTVVYDGKPVPNATVQFGPRTDGSVSGNYNYQFANLIKPTKDGAIPVLSQVSDDSGKVTFPGSSLALGVVYHPEVEPVSFQGVQLARYTTAPDVEIGAGDVDQVLSLSELVPGADTYGLYVTSVTPGDHQVQTDGSLTITFNIPVAKTSAFAAAFTASSAGTNGTINPQANASLSADGKTLTLTPNWTVAPTTIAAGSTITYGGGVDAVVVPAYPADPISVLSLSLADGSLASAHETVTIKAQ